MQEASLPEIRDYFGMSSSEFKSEWMVLSDDEKKFFKVEVGKVIHA